MKILVAPAVAVYRRMMELSTWNLFLVSHRDINVHNIVQSNSSFCIVNTVIWWWYMHVYVVFLSETHVVTYFYIYIYLYVDFENLWCTIVDMFSDLDIHCVREFIYTWRIAYIYSFILIIPIKGFLLLLLYCRVDLYLYIYFLVWSE